MPQLDFSTYSSQIFWFLICFAILYYFAHFIILPRIKEIIENRDNTIQKDENLAKELDSEISNLNKKSENLKSEAGQNYKLQIEKVVKNAKENKENSLQELKDKIEEMTQNSRKEIKEFVEKSKLNSEKAAKELQEIIKNKIVN